MLERIGVLLLSRCPAVPLTVSPAAPLPPPQLQLGFLFQQPTQRERYRPYCQALGVGHHECALGSIPQLGVECRRAKRDGP